MFSHVKMKDLASSMLYDKEAVKDSKGDGGHGDPLQRGPSRPDRLDDGGPLNDALLLHNRKHAHSSFSWHRTRRQCC